MRKGRVGGEEVGGAIADGFANALEVVEGVFELVAMDRLVAQALGLAGFEFFAPLGDQAVIAIEAGLGAQVLDAGGRNLADDRRHRGSGGGGAGGGGSGGHARK